MAVVSFLTSLAGAVMLLLFAVRMVRTGIERSYGASFQRLMTERRCRHVPVMDGETLLGLVSIGDLTKATQHNLRHEVRELSSYIGGPYLS